MSNKKAGPVSRRDRPTSRIRPSGRNVESEALSLLEIGNINRVDNLITANMGNSGRGGCGEYFLQKITKIAKGGCFADVAFFCFDFEQKPAKKQSGRGHGNSSGSLVFKKEPEAGRILEFTPPRPSRSSVKRPILFLCSLPAQIRKTGFNRGHRAVAVRVKKQIRNFPEFLIS